MESPAASNLWATPSKEWIIPPKAKAGRKPKKDPPKPNEDVDVSGRRVQNRAAQRAFRERKQSQLKELQARIYAYETREVERNVALQKVAKRLKDENELLRAENVCLKDKIAEMTRQLENDRKRWRDDSTSSRPAKKQKLPSTSPSPPSVISSSSASDISEPFSPIQLEPFLPEPAPFDMPNTSSYETDIFSSFNCGLCTAETHCVCRQVAFQNAADTPDLKFETLEKSNDVVSILDNLPAYQPPVPLRRKSNNTRARFWPVSESSNCSGDPSNCEACANDSFGQGFCEAINRSVSAQERCTDCPSLRSSIARQGSSCGTEEADMMPTNDAWQQLKAHPNVSFADLALLADVVAGRSKCTGPRVTLSPVPEGISDSPEPDSVLLADPHAQRPKLIPQEVLVKCGQERVRQVQAAGVRDALRLLDARRLL